MAARVHLTSSFVGVTHGLRRLNSSTGSTSIGNSSRSNRVTVSLMTSRREVIPLLATMLAAAAACGTPAAAANDEDKFTEAASGLQFYDTLVGSGESMTKGALIKVHYTGKLEDGTVFDSSYNRGKPLTFNVGVGQVIKGWDEGILGGTDVPPMLAGGKRKLRIPPSLGYGERGAGCRGKSCIIPPNSVLLFDVELLGK